MFGNFMLQLMQYVRRNNPEIVSHTKDSQEIIQSFLFFGNSSFSRRLSNIN